MLLCCSKLHSSFHLSDAQRRNSSNNLLVHSTYPKNSTKKTKSSWMRSSPSRSDNSRSGQHIFRRDKTVIRWRSRNSGVWLDNSRYNIIRSPFHHVVVADKKILDSSTLARQHRRIIWYRIISSDYPFSCIC